MSWKRQREQKVAADRRIAKLLTLGVARIIATSSGGGIRDEVATEKLPSVRR